MVGPGRRRRGRAPRREALFHFPALLRFLRSVSLTSLNFTALGLWPPAPPRCWPSPVSRVYLRFSASLCLFPGLFLWVSCPLNLHIRSSCLWALPGPRPPAPHGESSRAALEWPNREYPGATGETGKEVGACWGGARGWRGSGHGEWRWRGCISRGVDR